MNGPTNGPMYTRPFPRYALVIAGMAVGGSLLLAVVMHFVGVDTFPPTAPAVASRDLRFEDRPDGAIFVINAADGSLVETLAPGTNGFLRATLRGLVRERKRESAGRTTPFRLTGYADGRLTLEDPDTGRRVDLEAFGHSNLEVFARMLPTRSATP